MTDQEIKELVVSLAVARKETDGQLKERDCAIQEFRRAQEEANRELWKQLNRLGDFAEAMALPSLIEILAKRFRVEQIIETRRMRKNDDEIELDLIGAANGSDKRVVVAEVKSLLNQRELDKFVRNLNRFFYFFPQFKGYKLFGIIAAVDASREMEEVAFREGIAVARRHEDVFRLKEPSGFQPRNFAPA